MRLFRFDKTLKLIFALLCAVGFSTTAFAANDANTSGCGKNDSVHCSGPKYRCLKYFGHTKSYTLNVNPTDRRLGKYCLPKTAMWCTKYYDTKTKKEVDCGNDYSNPKCNMKEWDWDDDPKVDTVTETETSKNYCKFTTCEADGTERFWYGAYSNAYHVFFQPDKSDPSYNEPIDVYFYCALEGEDFNGGAIASEGKGIAKCVERGGSGEPTYNSLCDADTTGRNYYYKPNCTKADCSTLDDKGNDIGKMAQWNKAEKIKMCYNPWKQDRNSNIGESTLYNANAGGQTVSFSKYHFKNQQDFNGPCKYTPFTVAQYPGAGDTEKETIGNLLIMDEKDNRDADSLVHTKVSGEGYYFKIKEVGGDEDVDSSLKSLNCKITDKDGTEVVKESAAKQTSGGIVARTIAFFAGSGKRSQFQFPADTKFKPAASGDYTITCNGYGDDATTSIATASANFFVAPYQYVFENVSAIFENTTSGLADRDKTSNIVTRNMLDNKVALNYLDKATTGKKVNWTWANKPVVKIGDELRFRLSNVEAQTKEGVKDTGVDYEKSDKKMGLISAEANISTLAITNADNPQTAGVTTSTTCTLGGTINPLQNANGAKTGGTKMVGGVADGSESIAEITTQDAQVARATIDIYDLNLYQTIASEEGSEKCDSKSSTFPCPYPKKLRLENVDYEIAPKDFKIEVVDEKDNPIKVLYFGQGTSPKVEAGSKVSVTALKIDGTTANNKKNLDPTDIATTFTYGCAAQNMQFASDSSTTGSSGTGTQTSGVYFEIIGRDGSGFTVKASDFKNGVAGSNDAIIKVQKDRDTPFTPAMKSEPVIVDSANAIIPMEMQYEKFPPETTYYPKYNTTLSQSGSLVVLRGRINSIDTDNGSGSGAGGSITPTKVWYEFQCEYCNLDEVAKITGWDKNGGYTNADRSPTQQGWWIDRTFGENNGNYITSNKAEIESGGISISSISPNNGVDTAGKNTKGSQSISYGNKRQGTHKLNIRHGNESTDNTFKGATTMPYFLLYNAYWTGYADDKRDNNGNKVLDSSGNAIPTSTLVSPKKWNTSSFIYVKGASKDDPRNYGVDTGGAKNTRSGGRTGKF